MTLAIAAHNFSEPSETFIHDHVRLIAPGETILLCEDGRGAERFNCPVLSDMSSVRSGTPWERALHRILNHWQSYVDPGLQRAGRDRVARFLETYRPKAVLAEYGPTGCLLAGACRQAGVPLYVHFHGYDASRLLGDPFWLRSYSRLFKTAAGVIAPSKFIASKLLAIGCPESLIHVSFNGVDPQRFLPTQRLPQRILAVGRFVEKKAPHLTIEAFGRIAQRFPRAELDMVGDGPLMARCQALLREISLGDRVRLHGVQSSEFVAQLMGQASLFVQHSVTAENGETEGFAISILEAMASEIPVVVTRHNGFVEAVEHGTTGLLVSEHDVDGMAAAMAELLADPARATAMGVCGRQRVLERFTHATVRDRLRSIMRLPSLPLGETNAA